MKLHLYLVVLIVALGSIACEKDSNEYVIAVAQLSPEEQFDRMEKPLVLFHYAERQIETGREIGWIVDHNGWVKTYEQSFFPGSSLSARYGIVSSVELQLLYDAASDGIFQLDKADLVNSVFAARALKDTHLSPNINQPEVKVAQGFFAYTKRAEYQAYDGGGGCSGGTRGSDNGHTSYTVQNYRITVSLSGQDNLSETSVKGIELHQWLLDLGSGIQLEDLDQ